jgi:hypothetical protein
MVPLPLRSRRFAARRSATLRLCVLRLAVVFGTVYIGFAVGSSPAVLLAGDVQKVAAREKAVAPEPAGSADAAFRAVMPDGTVIELVGLCEHPSAGHDWWRPDGLPLGKTPAGEAPRELTQRPFNVFLGNPDALDRDVAIDARLPEGGEVELTSYYAKGSTGYYLKGIGSASTFKKSDDKKVLQSLRAVAQFQPSSRTNLIVHYAPQPWETYCEFQNWLTLRKGQRVRSGSVAVSRSNPTWGGVIMAQPTEQKGTTTIIAAFDFDDVEHRDFRIIAVDKAGINLRGKDQGYFNATHHAHMLMAHFENTPLEKIETFLFQSRKFQSVGFRNVSLHRGQKTNFEVHIGDEPMRQPTRYSQPGNRSAAKQSDPSSKEKPSMPHTPH